MEFAPKHTARLERIVPGYLASDVIDEVRWLVSSPAVARRLREIANQQRSALPLRRSERATRVVVDAWSGASELERAAIRRAIEPSERPRERRSA
jgi:hypothetical protein